MARTEQPAISPTFDAVPDVVHTYVGDLRLLIEGGQLEQVKRALTHLVSRIEVDGVPVEGRKRLQARLILHGNLQGVLELVREKARLVVAPSGFDLSCFSEEQPVAVINLPGWLRNRASVESCATCVAD